MTTGFDENGQQTSLIELRPMDIGDVLDGTIRVYRHNPWIYMGIMAVLLGIPLVISNGFWLRITPLVMALMETSMPGAEYGSMAGDPLTELEAMLTPDIYVYFGVYMVSSFASFFLSPLAQAALVHSVSETILGRAASVRDSIGYVMARAMNVILAYLIYGLILIALTVVLYGMIGAYVFLIAGGIVSGTASIVLGTMFLIIMMFAMTILMIFFFVKYMFIPHAVVLDNMGPIDALKRSFGLTTGYVWRVFGMWFLINMIVGIISSLLGQGVTLVTGAVGFLSSINEAIPIAIGSVLLTIITLVIQPLVIIATVMIYYDLRIRKEGFDLLLLASSVIKSNPDAPVDYSQDIPIG